VQQSNLAQWWLQTACKQEGQSLQIQTPANLPKPKEGPVTYKTRQELEDATNWRQNALPSLTKEDRRELRKNKKKRNRKKS